jgi:hypothetical protein
MCLIFVNPKPHPISTYSASICFLSLLHYLKSYLEQKYVGILFFLQHGSLDVKEEENTERNKKKIKWSITLKRKY